MLVHGTTGWGHLLPCHLLEESQQFSVAWLCTTLSIRIFPGNTNIKSKSNSAVSLFSVTFSS